MIRIRSCLWVITLLLGASCTSPLDQSAYLAAVEKGDRAFVAKYLEAGGDPNVRNKYGDPALVWAAYRQDVYMVRSMLAAGADPSLHGSLGRTALHWASLGSRTEAVLALLDAGADVQANDDAGDTPLHLAAREGHGNTIHLLTRGQSNLDGINHDGKTPLLLALAKGDRDAVVALIQGGADPRAKGGNDISALDWALKNGVDRLLLTPEILSHFPDMHDWLQGKITDNVVNAAARPKIIGEDLARQLHSQVNRARERAGLSPLVFDPRLAQLASGHGRDMVRHGYFGHANSEGASALDRLRGAGFPTAKAGFEMGQIIYRTKLYRGSSEEIVGGQRQIRHTWRRPGDLPREIVVDWLDREEKRKELLAPYYHQQGIGVAVDGEDNLIITGLLTGVRDIVDAEPDGVDQAPPMDVALLARSIHDLLNQERLERGLVELPLNQNLVAMATEHSADMAANRYLGHESPKGEGPDERAERHGITVNQKFEDFYLRHGIGENLFRGRTYASTTQRVEQGLRKVSRDWYDLPQLARAVVDGLMADESNRANILNQTFESQGIGVAINAEQQVYVTQNLKMVALDDSLVAALEKPRDRPNYNLARIARQIHRLVNLERKKHGSQPLTYDPALAVVAEAHSVDMAKYQYFSHVDRKGERAKQRAEAKGYVTSAEIGVGTVKSGIAENIFRDRLFSRLRVDYVQGRRQVTLKWYSEEEIAANAVAGWMKSKGHRANILNEIHQNQGIGLALGTGQRFYITQNFF